MKRLFIPSLVACFLLSGCASLYLKNGKQAYEDLRYQDAIWFLEKGLAKKDDADAKWMLAMSYLTVDEYDKASDSYGQSALNPSTTDLDRLNQGRSLMAAGRYSEARQLFEAILSREPSNEVAQALLSSCRELDKLKSDSLTYAVTPVNIPGITNAFSPVPYNNGLLFTTVPAAHGDKDPYTNRAFTDLYFSKYNGTAWEEPQPLDDVNGKYHDASAVVSPNGQNLVYTRSFMLRKNAMSSNTRHENTTQLYWCHKVGDNAWSEPELIPFCDSNNMYAHPAFSPDGGTLYFSSDMAGGQGGMDIWSSKSSGGTWESPVNLGRSINSKGDELFPTTRGADTLYFSSDSHTSMGGLDIVFSVRQNGNQWSDPDHLSYPINSHRDDFGLVWTDKENGYFSSARSGSDRIYSFHAHSPEVSIKMLVAGKDSQLPLGGTEVVVVNMTDGTEKSYFTDGDGMVNIPLDPGKDYKVKSQLEGYFTQTEEITTKGVVSDKVIERVVEMKEVYVTKPEEPTTGNEKAKPAPTEKKGNYQVPNIYWDYNKWDIRPDSHPYLDELAQLFRDNARLRFEIRSHCDCRGSKEYNYDLSSKRAKAVADYLVAKGVPRHILTSKGFGEDELVNQCTDGVYCDESLHQQNRRTEFIVTEKK